MLGTPHYSGQEIYLISTLIQRAIAKLFPLTIYLYTLYRIGLVYKYYRYINLATIMSSLFYGIDMFLLDLEINTRSKRRKIIAEKVYQYGFINLLNLDKDINKYKC